MPLSSRPAVLRRLAVPLTAGVLGATLLAPVTADATTAMTAPMTERRASHTATALPEGSVLVVGGMNGPVRGLRPAEVFRPTTRTWESAGSVTIGRDASATASVGGGRVLVTGGLDDASGELMGSTEVYDDGTGTWTGAGSLVQPRYQHVATTLQDGRVLVTGGSGIVGDTWKDLSSSEIFDAGTGAWSTTGPLAGPRLLHTATLLEDGTVLVVGGSDGKSSGFLRRTETFDPDTGLWTNAGALGVGRAGHTATLMGDGKVLVTGGFNGGGTTLATSEVYNPATRTWSSAAPLSAPRKWHNATALSDGRVLVAGGKGTTSTDVYSPISKTWRSAGTLSTERAYPSVTGLPDGTALVAGGFKGSTYFKTAEIVTPPAVEHARSVTLAGTHQVVSGTRRLVLSGKLSVADATTACASQRPVVLARLDPGTGQWKQVAAPTSADDGTYRAVVRDQTGRYRARVAAQTITQAGSASTCGAAEALRQHSH